MKDAIVVGCGIIGATVALALRKQGMDVMIIDDKREGRGTKPSGGHLKPSWFGSMKKAEYEPAMELLDDVWGLHTEKFVVYPTTIKAVVYRVDTDQVERTARTLGRVRSVRLTDSKFPKVVWEDGEERCRMLIIATGVWIPEWFPHVQMQLKKGVSFRYSGKLRYPFIKPWAPYKQVVAHQQASKEIWVGDGSAILEKNWTAERTQQCQKRCAKGLKSSDEPVMIYHGLRAYCKTGGNPCLLERVGKKTWIATGAGKSGTIAAGWVARKILDEC